MILKNLLNISENVDLVFPTLAFQNKELELKFDSDYNNKYIHFQRKAILITLLVFSLFGFLDYSLMSGDSLKNILMIRYCFGVPSILILYIFSYSKLLVKNWQLVSTIATTLTGISITLIIIATPAPIVYFNYPGLMLVIMVASSMLRLRFIYIVASGLLLIILYAFSAKIFIDLPNSNYINNLFFFIATYLLGLLSGFILELHERRNFYLNYQLEIEKNNTKSLLEYEINLNNMKTRFINVTSHVFRNPMTSLISSAQLVNDILKYKDIDKAQYYNNFVIKSAEEILEILNRVQFIIRHQSGELLSYANPFNFNEAIKLTIEKVQKIYSPSQKLEIEYLDDDQFFTSDRSLITIAFQEMLINAIKYSPDDSIIHVSLKKSQNNEIELTIKDYGVGISQEKVNSFQNSFDFDSDSTITGMGLGFVIIRICRILLRGKCIINPVDPNGTEFKFVISELEPKF